MPSWWQSSPASSSSSNSESSPSSSAAAGYHRRGSRPRLKFQKKLRHLTELDLAAYRKRAPSAGASPETTPLSRSPSTRVLSPGRPQPLPLPGVSRSSRRDGISGSNCPLPSPKDASSRGSEDKDRDRVDALIGDVPGG